jgi:hypothetical protein
MDEQTQSPVPLTAFWDPSNTPFDEAKAAEEDAKLEGIYQKYQTHPHRVNRIFTLLVAIFWPLAFLLGYLFLAVGASLQALILPIIFLLIPWGYKGAVKATQDDLTLLFLTRAKGWRYLRGQNSTHWESLKGVFPEIFDKDGHSQYVNEQIWGSVQGEHGAIPFWLGTFMYTVGYGKNSHTYTLYTYAVQLQKTLTADLVVEPQTGFNKFAQAFTTKEIEMESMEFNKLFRITYKGQRSEVAPHIFETLNPAVMSNLIDMRNAGTPFSLVFRGSTLLISQATPFFTMKYTDFFKKPEVDPRDISGVEEQLQKILKYVGDISFHLD